VAGYDGGGEPAHGLSAWPAELFLLRGADREAAARQLERLAELAASNDAAGRGWRLRDLAWTIAAGVDPALPVQVAVVARDLDELAAAWPKARAFTADPRRGVFVAASAGEGPGRVAFLFPGQGSQRPGMLADLFVAFPRLRAEISGPAARFAGRMFPPAAFDAETEQAQQAALADTRVAQPALGVVDLAAYRLLTSLGVRPDQLAGHSYGEVVALAAAGALDPADLVELSVARATAILNAAGADPGAMAAVAAAPEVVRAALAGHGDVVLANHNAPAQTVISGPTAAIEAAVAELVRRRIGAKRLRVACAFHSPVIAGAATAFAASLAQRPVSAPAVEVWGNTDATPYPQGPERIRAVLAGQLAAPVRFVEQIEAMYAAGARTFVEAGPGDVLTRLVRGILGDRPHTAVALDRAGEPGLPRLLRSLAELAVAGVPVDPEPLFAGRAAVVPAAATPRRAGWTVDGHLVRTAAGDCLPGGLRPAEVVITARSPEPAVAEPTTAARDAAVLEFLRGTREMVAAQREVVLGYLGTSVLPAEPPTVRVVEIAAPAPVAAAEPARPAPAATPAGRDVLALVVATVSERTGYPPEMLNPGLDLEADLSVDSIKRTELIGELADRLDLGGGAQLGESVVEELARIKTIRGIVDWIEARSGTPTAGGPLAPALTDTLRRFVVGVHELPHPAPASPGALAGRAFTVVADGRGIGLELAELLEEHGASARIHGDLGGAPAGDGLVYLAGLGPEPAPELPAVFDGLRRALLGGVRALIVATGSAGAFGHGWAGEPATDPTAGAGLRGLLRTVAREYPDVLVRAVDIDPKEAPHKIARHLLDELCTSDAPVVVGYTNGTRSTLRASVEPLPAAADSAAACRAAGLGRDSVVLLTGGARGITAAVAAALAAAGGCHLELVGRTPLPDTPPDPQVLAAAGESGLRRLLVERGLQDPAAIGAGARRLAAEREIHQNLERLAGAAASVRYTALDVRDAGAVARLIADIRSRHGRLDTIVHGAGLCEDRLIVDKTPESFSRVFDTKVGGARALVAAAPAELAHLVLFGSVSGVFGNRGQADYSAANDALDTLARTWQGRAARRVLSVDWGPWAPEAGGMVSAELALQYARRGVGLIDAADAVAALLAELAWGRPEQCQVGFLAAPLETFE